MLDTKLQIQGHKGSKLAFSLKVLGLALDVTGSLLVAKSLVDLNSRVQSLDTTEGLSQKAKRDLENQSETTIIGISLIAAGFALMFCEEIYASVSLS